jgi:uncharacterized protein (TIGR03437 family)
MKGLLATSAVAALAVSCWAQPYTIATVAGGGIPPYPGNGDGGPATSAYLNQPRGVAVDSSGNVFVAGSSVRKISPSGTISTAANYPASAVAVDAQGNLYLAVNSQAAVIKVATNGNVTTLVTLPSGSYAGPNGVAVDNSGHVYYSWRGPNGDVVSKVDSSGTVTLVAGGAAYSASLGDGGSATHAYLSDPRGLALDSSGNLYIADFGNNRVRVVNSAGSISTLAGNGSNAHSGDGASATQAGIYGPYDIAVDSSSNVFVAEWMGNTVRVVHSDGTITTFAGTGSFGSSGEGGLATSATLGNPYGVGVGPGGRVFVSTEDGLVRVLAPPIPAPAINANGVVPVFSTVTTIQPGEWVSIYGSNLAIGTYYWQGDFPQTLGGTSVTINGKPAYLWFVGPQQINLQAPDDTQTGPVSVVVTTASGTATSSVTLAPFAPSFKTVDGRHVGGIIHRANGAYDYLGPSGNSFGYPSVAAKAGDIIEIYGFGFGPTNPPVPSGQIFNGAASTVNPVTITINNIAVPASAVLFSGLSGAGVYQFDVTVPAGLGTGDVPLQATVSGVSTPTGVVISLQ